MDPSGRVVLITGGAGGIGAAMAAAFVRAGARVVIADVDEARLAGAARRLADQGAPVATRVLDVPDWDAWNLAIDEVAAEHGPVGVLCNNAGVVLRGRAEDLDPAQWERAMAINVNGVFHGVRAFVPHAKAHGQGAHIVNTASIYGLFSGQGAGAYITSKFAILGFSEVLRFELETDGIGVSVLCPGLVDTAFSSNSGSVLRPGETPPPSLNGGRMSPEAIGPMVVRAVREGRFYVITHPEYAPVVEARHRVLMRDFAQGAQPGYSEDPADIGGHWLRYAATLS